MITDHSTRLGLMVALAAVFLSPDIAAAQTPITTIVNPGFETGTPGQPVSVGWSTISGEGPMYIVDSTIVPLLEGIDPSAPYEGSQFLTGNRNAGGDPPAAGVGVMQDVDLTDWDDQIDAGDRGLELSFAYNDADGADFGIVQFSFLNGSGSPIGNQYSFNTDTAETGAGSWSTQSLVGTVPALARTLRLELTAPNAGGTLRNINYDDITANLVDAPAPPPEPSGLVQGNLIQFNIHGAWSWYMDERGIVDPTNGHVLVGSTVAQGGGLTTGRTPGAVDVVDFNPSTGQRDRTQLSGIEVDDHNAPGLLVLPDGRYLAMYSNHGNSGGLGDQFTRWRRSNSPGDTSSWTTEQLFNWHDEVPGADQATDAAAPGNVSYHNLFYLSAEDQVYDISRSYGQLSSNGATQNVPNIARYDVDTNSMEWAGQVMETQAGGYSAYPKYVSNGVDRIYFITTETHPRDYNNSIFAGYIEDGQTFDMDGTLIDVDLFDNEVTNPGVGAVPDVTDFSLVQQSDPLGAGYNRLWTTDLALGSGGNPVALYTSRLDNNTSDHRLHYARYDGSTWHTYEVAHMAEGLYGSEQDYTGLGAIVPGDENTIYISTPVDPRDASGNTVTAAHEIYKGVTADGGANWTWSAITENSPVDNLRPIIPDSQGGDTTVIWFRGNYVTAQNIDSAVVGIVEREESVGLVNYLDADTSNTTRTNGSPIGATGPGGSAGAADGDWHERTGFGNDGSVLTSNESGSEDAPTLRTTIENLSAGLYDIFAYFWSDNDEDWRLQAGLDQSNLIDFRMFGSQHAETDQFVTIDTVSANDDDLLLYRAYLGRADLTGVDDVDVYIDDWSTSNANYRTWYDGVGYALVGDIGGLPGDFDGDDDVDGDDFLAWQRDPSIGDLADWEDNYGTVLQTAVIQSVPEPSTWVMLALAVLPLCRLRV